MDCYQYDLCVCGLYIPFPPVAGVSCEGDFVYLENYPELSCYKFELGPLQWAAAKDVCSDAYGANLVTFETVEEHQAMIDNLKARSKLGRDIFPIFTIRIQHVLFIYLT